jgi:hypothetical protein
MSNARISELIQRLKDIRLQEAQVIAEIESDLNQGTSIPGTVVSASTPFTTSPDPNKSFMPGDRVLITNKINKKSKTSKPVLNTPASQNRDRLATVISVAGDRVHLITDSGISTWRIPKNITLIQRTT